LGYTSVQLLSVSKLGRQDLLTSPRESTLIKFIVSFQWLYIYHSKFTTTYCTPQQKLDTCICRIRNAWTVGFQTADTTWHSTGFTTAHIPWS